MTKSPRVAPCVQNHLTTLAGQCSGAVNLFFLSRMVDPREGCRVSAAPRTQSKQPGAVSCPVAKEVIRKVMSTLRASPRRCTQDTDDAGCKVDQ